MALGFLRNSESRSIVPRNNKSLKHRKAAAVKSRNRKLLFEGLEERRVLAADLYVNDNWAFVADNGIIGSIDAGDVISDANDGGSTNYIVGTDKVFGSVTTGVLTGPLPGGSTIQSAIDASVNGDTVNILQGTFVSVGQINIAKDISLVGAGMDLTILKRSGEATGTEDRAIEISTSGVTIQSLTLGGWSVVPSNANVGNGYLAWNDADLTTFDKVRFDANDNRVGIYTGTHSDLTVTNSRFTGTLFRAGIRGAGERMNISYNSFEESHYWYGPIYFEYGGATSGVIHHNYFANRVGVNNDVFGDFKSDGTGLYAITNYQPNKTTADGLSITYNTFDFQDSGLVNGAGAQPIATGVYIDPLLSPTGPIKVEDNIFQGYKYTGITPSTSPLWQPSSGVFGGALEFDGIDDFGVFQSPLFDVGTRGTLNFWVKMDNVSKRNQFFEGPGDAGMEVQFRSNSGGQFYGRETTVGGDFVIRSGPDGATALNTWKNIQLIWDFAGLPVADGGGKLRIYVDGVESSYLAGSTPTDLTWGSVVSTVNGLMNVGRDPSDATRYFDGMMDDIGWFNNVLTAAERNSIRATGVATLSVDPRLVAHWDLNQSSGSVAVDNKNGIQMFLSIDGALPAQFGPQFVPAGGQFGGALEFDGLDDYGTFAFGNNELGDKGTLNFWVRMDDTTRRNQFFEGPGNGGLEVQYRNNSGGQFYTRTTDGSGNVIRSGPDGAASLGVWRNIQVTWDYIGLPPADGGGKMRIYVDGVESSYLAGFTPTTATWTSIGTTINGIMSVGRDPGDPTRFFDGRMDDVAFFNDVLNSADRNTLRTSSGSAFSGDPRMVAYWNLDNTIGTSIVPGNGGTSISLFLQAPPPPPPLTAYAINASPTVVVNNNIFWDNQVNYNAAVTVGVNGNVVADPLFAGIANGPATDQKYAIRFGSPAVSNGTGFPTAGLRNIGAYQGTPVLPAGVVYVNEDWAGLALNTFLPDVEPSIPGNQSVYIGFNGHANITNALAVLAPGGQVAIFGNGAGGPFTNDYAGFTLSPTASFRLLADNVYGESNVTLDGAIDLNSNNFVVLLDQSNGAVNLVTTALGTIDSSVGTPSMTVNTSSAGQGVVTLGGTIGGTGILSTVAINSVASASLSNISANAAGGISVSASGTISVGVLAASLVTLVSSNSSITDTNLAATNIVGSTLIATAATGIDLDTTIATLTANTTCVFPTLGPIRIDETDAITLTSVITQSGSITVNAGGTVTATNVVSSTDASNVIKIVTSAGDILAGNISASGDTVDLNAAGSIEELGSDGTADIVADIMRLTAVSGIGALGTIEINTDVDPARGLTASVTGTGPIDLRDVSGMRVISATAANGNITLVASTSNLTIETITASTAGNTVNLIATAGAIVDGNGATANVTATNLAMSASTGIGSSADPIETAVSNLEATTGSGGIFVANAGNLQIGGVNGIVGVNAVSGNIVVTTTGSLKNIEGVKNTNGDITLSAIDAAGAGQDITVAAAIEATAGQVTFNAGDDLFVTSTVKAGTTVTGNVDSGNADGGTGGVFTLSGSVGVPVAITAPGGTFLNGNTDNDTFNVYAQTTTAFSIDGDLPVGTLTGDILSMNVTGTGATLTVGGTAPYNGPGSGTWTFAPSLQSIRFKSIEDSQITGSYHLTYDFANSAPVTTDLFVMRDATTAKLQLRDGSNAGPILFQANLAPNLAGNGVLSLNVLGTGNNESVTVDDINTLPVFAAAVPGTPDNAILAGQASLLFQGAGGTNKLNFALTGANISQTYAIGNGAGVGSEGEVQTVAGAGTLTSYFTGLGPAGSVNRTGGNNNPGSLTILGDNLGNTINVTGVTAVTNVNPVTYTPFNYSASGGTHSYSALNLAGLGGNDTLNMQGFGSSVANDPTILLDGGNNDDILQVGSTSGNLGAISILGQAGNDTIRLYTDGLNPSGANRSDLINGKVTVDGGAAGGNDQLFLVALANTAALTNVQITSTTIDNVTPAASTDVTFSNINLLDVTTTNLADTITTTLTAPSVNNDLAVVTVHGGDSSDQFYLHIPATPTNTPAGLTNINLLGDAGDDYFGSNADRIIPAYSKASGADIFINGGTPDLPAFDPVSKNSIDGDKLTGDRIYLDMSSATAPVIVDTVTGFADSASHRRLVYNGIEDIDLYDNAGQLQNVHQGSLYMRATEGSDYLVLMGLSGGKVRIRANNGYYGDYAPVTKLVVHARGGNDYIATSVMPANLPLELYGDEGDDSITGSAAGDLIVGGEGLDRLSGGAGGIDEMWGDVFNPITANPNLDIMLDPTNPLAIGIRASQVDKSTFNSLGGPAANPSTDGNDIITTSAGNGADRIYGQGGNDIVTGSAQDDVIYGGDGIDNLSGANGNDRIYGNAGNDNLAGEGGDDFLFGGDGNDTLNGGLGNDALVGGIGQDILRGDQNRDMVIGGTISYSGVNSGTADSKAYGDSNDVAMLELLNNWRLAVAPSIPFAGLTVTNDGEIDSLSGGDSTDDFYNEAVDLLINYLPTTGDRKTF